MNKKRSILTLSLLLAGLCAFAQTIEDKDENIWTEFDVHTGSSRIVDLNTQTQETTLEGMAPCAVVGGDDRREITGEANSWERAVVVLEMNIDKNRVGFCSGTLVGPDVVLTASHCLINNGKYVESVNVVLPGVSGSSKGGRSAGEGKSKKKDDPSEKTRSPKQTGECSVADTACLYRLVKEKYGKKKGFPGSLQQNMETSYQQQRKSSNVVSVKAAKLIANTKYIELDKKTSGYSTEKKKVDYAIVMLEQPVGNEYGWLGLSVKKDKELKGLAIVEIGRPGDKEQRTLWRGEGKIGQVNRYSFYHSADQMPGNSGGPIFAKGDLSRIIGLSNFGPADNRPVDSGYPNGGMRITDAVVKAVYNWR